MCFEFKLFPFTILVYSFVCDVVSQPFCVHCLARQLYILPLCLFELVFVLHVHCSHLLDIVPISTHMQAFAPFADNSLDGHIQQCFFYHWQVPGSFLNTTYCRM